MARTMTKKLQMTPDICYKRLRHIMLEVEKKVVPCVMKMYNMAKTHDENCDLHLQQEYVSLGSFEDTFVECAHVLSWLK